MCVNLNYSLSMASNTNHASPLQLLWAGLRQTDTSQRVVSADRAHVVHALGVLSLLGGLSAVNGSTLASPHAILIKSVTESPLDGVKAKVPDDGPNPGSNDIVPTPCRKSGLQASKGTAQTRMTFATLLTRRGQDNAGTAQTRVTFEALPHNGHRQAAEDRDVKELLCLMEETYVQPMVESMYSFSVRA